ncbi:Hypothetical predicted protein [Mytilus galloprovincialis]|uniref:Novel STAND NTPase 3 domain-containing protein n=1 Tax=Mytilus galloprovincialis TaxID=29158 RepID=A0A8B6FA57_MYTGA|nr:Hypothetical predicted protein [Mytilus galloprovincialis]
MTDPTQPGPLHQTIPPDLQKDVEDIQTKVPNTPGPPEDLDEEKKRWLIAGICLHSVISPVLRKYVDPIISNLYNSLVSSDSIDTQGCHKYLKKYPVTNRYCLSYESINNNKNYRSYDYRVKGHVDLSKLFLQPSMAHYSGFNESCDSSALLGMVINISSFPPNVQTDSEMVRSDIRNPWAHCDFREWTATKYADSFQLMGQLVKDIGLGNREENRILGELNTWATNGQHFVSGTRLGLEIVGDIRQQTNVLSRYVQTLCSGTDSQFITVRKELSRIENDLQGRIKNLENKTNEHDESLNTLKEEIQKVEDHIPPHIRAHHKDEIREWEQDQTTFLETRATRHILDSLPVDNCIVVTGSSGCGKSSNIHHAALHLRDSFGYEIIPVLVGPTDIMNYYNKNKKQVFVVDDICGKETINTQTLQMWRDYSDKNEKIFKVDKTDVGSNNEKTVSEVSGPRLLISCRLHIYKESQFQRIPLFTKKECNVLSPALRLRKADRRLMLKKYLPNDIIIDNIKVTESVDYFPLLCKLSKEKTSEEVRKLFTAPLISIKQNINTIIDENKEQLCALTLCILFRDGFNTDWLKTGSSVVNTTDTLEDIVKQLDIDLSKEKHRNSLKAGFSTLNGTYLKLRGIEYRIIHDKIYTMAAKICGQHLPECFIKHAPAIFIRDNFIFESVMEVHEKDNLIVLSKDEEEYYFERLLFDLTKHVIISTFNNSQLIHKTFRDKLISFLKRSDDAKTVLKKLDIEIYRITNNHPRYLEYKDKETFVDTTPLLESASAGYIDIVQFLIVNVKCNVNNTDSQHNSPLYKASERGHSAIAKLLLENNANVSQCNSYRKRFPLSIASEGGHNDTVVILLQNNADVNQCTAFGESPLSVACEGGHVHTVELLLQSNANVNQCDKCHRTPLHAACKGGHTQIVDVLLQYNADVNQCDDSDESPLYAACNSGYKDTVELLLQNNADVSQCDDFGESPLYVACEGGHAHTVDLLLQNNADVNQCDEDGKSPLSEACKKGYKDTVKLLLQYNVDVNQCDECGITPLYIACHEGYKETVELLLKKIDDVNQCDNYGQSPLFVACGRVHRNIVELLLQKNADVNQCDIDGESPLHAVCSYNYQSNFMLCKVEKGLLSKRRIATVKLLLAWEADFTLRNTNGQTPLDIARKSKLVELVNLLEENLQLKI